MRAQNAILATILSVLDAVNQPPLSAGIDFTAVATNQGQLIDDYCAQRKELRSATAIFLAGGVALLLATIIMLAKWEKYSKAWEFAPQPGDEGAQEEREMMRASIHPGPPPPRHARGPPRGAPDLEEHYGGEPRGYGGPRGECYRH